MDDSNCFMNCGDILIHYSLIDPKTRRFFDKYLSEDAELLSDGTALSPDCEIRITPAFIEENRWLVNADEQDLSFREFQSLMLATGNELLYHHRALFHGAALLWKGRAWILTAPSGTGKTTQLRHWKRLLKREAKVINGDKPLLVCREDGTVWVYSSPWRGKERYGIPGLRAPLGGILLLKQGEENHIRRIDPGEAVLPLFTEFVSFPEDTGQIQCQAQILEQVLGTIPVWELTNLGDEKSAQITLETLQHFLEAETEDRIDLSSANFPVEGVKDCSRSRTGDREPKKGMLCPGIILIEIHGVYFLAADKEARKTCPYIREVNEIGAFIWKLLERGSEIPEIILQLRQEYDVPEDCDLEAEVETFIRTLKENHYMINESERYEV